MSGCSSNSTCKTSETRVDLNRLASTKHSVAGNTAATTFATGSTTKELPIETRVYCNPTEEQSCASESDATAYRFTQLPRRKDIHKRIGRLLLRISRMCSENQHHTCAYQHGAGASELPAGESPVEGTTSFYEMPGSFPRVELEQPYGEKVSSLYSWNQRISHSTAPEHLQEYYRSNENSTLRRTVPLPATNQLRLPRLEVPQSQYSVPILMSDHSPLTPSPISPFTPIQGANSPYGQNSNSQLYIDAVSLCAYSEQDQTFAHYGSWATGPRYSPATPSTAASYGSSLAATPLSAHSSSTSSSFQSWPQTQTERTPPAYSQAPTTGSYNPRMNDPSAVGTISWSYNSHLQPHSNLFTAYTQPAPHDSGFMHLPITATSSGTKLEAQSCYGEQRQLCEPQSLPLIAEPSFDYDAPPAYNSVTLDPEPSATNPRQHHPPSVCQHCGKIFTGKYGPGNCKRHVQQIHKSVLDRVRHMCKMCSKTYNRADALRKHAWKKHRLEEFRPNKRRKNGL